MPHICFQGPGAVIVQDYLDKNRDILSSLTHEAGGIPVVIFDSEMTVYYCNAPFAAIYNSTPVKLVGSGLGLIMNEEIYREKRMFVHESLRLNKKRSCYSTVRGDFYRSTASPINADDYVVGKLAFALCVVENCSGMSEVEFSTQIESNYYIARYHDFGRINILTPRELQVLACLAKGCTNIEVASDFHRSVRTIEGHRRSIMQKLGLAHAQQMMMMAQHAGLHIIPSDRLNAAAPNRQPRAGQAAGPVVMVPGAGQGELSHAVHED